jgi:transposase
LSRSNDPVPVETRLQLVLAVLAHEMTVAEAARRHGVSAESINRWRNRFVDAGKAAMEASAASGNVCPVRRLCHRADGR